MLDTVPPFLRHIKINIYTKSPSRFYGPAEAVLSHFNKENNKKDKTTLAHYARTKLHYENDIWIFKYYLFLIGARPGLPGNRAAKSISVVNHTQKLSQSP